MQLTWVASAPLFSRSRNSRRSFLKSPLALVGITLLVDGWLQAQSVEAGGPLLACVGTFSSPLRDVLPTQVDLPPGNGRGIHLFEVNRDTGAMTPAGICAMGTSPSCLALNAAGTRLYSANETNRVGEEWTRGNQPRSFSFDPTGRFLYRCNQRADHVAVFRVNRRTGGLSFTGHCAPVGNPSMVVFVDLATAG